MPRDEWEFIRTGQCDHCGEDDVDLYFHPVLETFSDGVACSNCVTAITGEKEKQEDREAERRADLAEQAMSDLL